MAPFHELLVSSDAWPRRVARVVTVAVLGGSQLQLLVEQDRPRLLRFLKFSHYYSLDEVRAACASVYQCVR